MTESIKRREFTAAMALALLGGATITVTACGGGGYGGGGSGSGNPSGPTDGGSDYGPGGNIDPGGGVVGQISANHGHRAVISRAELNAANGLDLDIQGQASHTHSVALTAAQVMTIRDGGRVSMTSSSTQSHQHTVTFN